MGWPRNMPVKRPLSQLLYTRIRESDTSPRVITLHDRGLMGRSAADYGLATTDEGRVIALESYKGVYVGRSIVGYTWFIGPDDRPSPIFFGDALAEIERFLWDEVDRQPAAAEAELPFLVGVGQGGIMALAAAAAVPDLLSGVVAIDAFLPVVPGWEPPLVPLADLPMLLLEREGSVAPGDGVLHGDDLVGTLRSWGATVTYQPDLSPGIPDTHLSRWIDAQAVRHLAPTPLDT